MLHLESESTLGMLSWCLHKTVKAANKAVPDNLCCSDTRAVRVRMCSASVIGLGSASYAGHCVRTGPYGISRGRAFVRLCLMSTQ